MSLLNNSISLRDLDPIPLHINLRVHPSTGSWHFVDNVALYPKSITSFRFKFKISLCVYLTVEFFHSLFQGWLNGIHVFSKWLQSDQRRKFVFKTWFITVVTARIGNTNVEIFGLVFWRTEVYELAPGLRSLEHRGWAALLGLSYGAERPSDEFFYWDVGIRLLERRQISSLIEATIRI